MTTTSTPSRPRPRTLSKADRDRIYANTCAQLEAHGVNPRRAKTVAAVLDYFHRLAAVFPDRVDGDDVVVNPSVERIAVETRSSVRGVKMAIARLTELGLVRTVRRTGRAAWRAVSGAVVRIISGTSRGANNHPARGADNHPREVQTNTVGSDALYISSSLDQKNDRRVVAGTGADRRRWAPSATATPTPPQYVPESDPSEPFVPASDPAHRARLKATWRKRGK